MGPEGQILDGRYQFLEPIGSGGAGTVYLGYHLGLQKYVVIKRISLTRHSIPSRTEVDTLKKLHHSNIPQVYDFITVGSEGFTVMDFVDGTDLESALKSGAVFTEKDLTHWLGQLTEVLVYLQKGERPVLHSDIKPANVMITPDNDAILIDFNVSLSGDYRHLLGLSVDFASPEQAALVSGAAYGTALDCRSDMYSLAATFYTLMTHRRPSPYSSCSPLTEEETGFSQAFCDVINRAMRFHREERYPDPREMLSDLRSLYKKTAVYRRKIAIRICACVLGLALAAGGVYFAVSGYRAKERNQVKNEYNVCVQEMNGGRLDEAAAHGLRILNEYDKTLGKMPELRSSLLLDLGYCFREQGNYVDGERYYLMAAEEYQSGDPEFLECYEGAVLCAAEAGNEGRAEYLITNAETAGLSSDRLRLLRVQLDSRLENREACLREARALNAESGDGTVAALAALAAAEITEGEERLNWLRAAYARAGSDAENLRRIGWEALSLAAGEEGTLRSEAAALAADCYGGVKGRSDSNTNDYLNLSTALRLAGKYDEAIGALDELEKNEALSPGEGILAMHRAFAASEKEDYDNAERWLRIAKNGVTEDTVAPAEWERLGELLREFEL